MIDLTTYALLRKQIATAASGVSDVRAEGDELVFVLADGREVRVAVPATGVRTAEVRDGALVLTLADGQELVYTPTTTVVDTTLTQSGQAADAKVTGDALSGKLTEPSEGLAVGKYFRIAAIDESGHAVLEAVDLPSAPVQDVQVDGTSIVADGVANVNKYDVVRAAMCDGKGAAWTSEEQAAALKRIGGAFAGWKTLQIIEITEYVQTLIINLYNTDISEIAIVVDAIGTGVACKYKISVTHNNGYEFFHWNDSAITIDNAYSTYAHLSRFGNYWKCESITPRTAEVYATNASSKIIPYNKRHPVTATNISNIKLLDYDLGIGSKVYVMTR